MLTQDLRPSCLLITDLVAKLVLLLGFVQPELSKVDGSESAAENCQEGVYSEQGIWRDIYKCVQVNSIMQACSDGNAPF